VLVALAVTILLYNRSSAAFYRRTPGTERSIYGRLTLCASRGTPREEPDPPTAMRTRTVAAGAWLKAVYRRGIDASNFSASEPAQR
jgi:hypothetical protein